MLPGLDLSNERGTGTSRRKERATPPPKPVWKAAGDHTATVSECLVTNCYTKPTTGCASLLASRCAASLVRACVQTGSQSEVSVATGSVSGQRIPSVDPEIKQAADDVVRDPDAYFERQRALCAREAEEYVGRELARAFSMRRRAGVWASLARLAHG